MDAVIELQQTSTPLRRANIIEIPSRDESEFVISYDPARDMRISLYGDLGTRDDRLPYFFLIF